jgi:predicted solute-binding protein
MPNKKEILFKGSFCWHGESHVLYSHAINETKAFQNCCIQLAKKLEYSANSIRNYFKNSDRYEITKENEKNMKIILI